MSRFCSLCAAGAVLAFCALRPASARADRPPSAVVEGDLLLVAEERATSTLPAPPLGQGRLRAWRIAIDPADSGFGQVVPGSGPEGVLWDAGELLAQRPAWTGEHNQWPGHDNRGPRQLWTHASGEGVFSALLPFDWSGLESGVLQELMLPGHGPIPALDPDGWERFDHDGDGYLSDWDAALLVDFARGVPWTPVGPARQPRGVWKLGSSSHGVAALAASEPGILARSSDFGAFLQELGQRPSMVYLPAADGVLHAFHAETGVEWWGFLPHHLLSAAAIEEGAMPWEQSLNAQLQTGEGRSQDGRCSVELVWLDGHANSIVAPVRADLDGRRHASEWHRILICSMGSSSGWVYALDVTDPVEPRFLWEQQLPAGRALGQPVLARAGDPLEPGRRRPFLWLGPGGRAGLAPLGERLAARSHLLFDVLDPGRWSGLPSGLPAPLAHEPPLPTGFIEDLDGDGLPEFDAGLGPGAGVWGTPAVVDLDADGAADALYVGSRSGHLYKAIWGADPTAPQVCEVLAPLDGATSWSEEARGLFHPPSVAWDRDGALRISVGSGHPWLDEEDTRGVFYDLVDPTPWGCTRAVASRCAALGATRLGPGERLVAPPLTAAGAVYYQTWQPGPGRGTSRLHGRSLETCEGVLPDDEGLVLTRVFEGALAPLSWHRGRLIGVLDDGAEVSPIEPIPAVPGAGERDLAGQNLWTWRQTR